MRKQDIIKKIQQKEVMSYLKDQGISKISLFGSYAMDQAKKDSDIDFLFEEKKGKILSLFQLAQVIGFLKTIFKRNVDMVEKKYLDVRIKRDVLAHKIDII